MGMQTFPLRGGSAAANYEAALYANLLAMARQQSADYGLPNGRLWACADAANLTLTNASITGGAVANTVVDVVPTLTSGTGSDGGTAIAATNNPSMDAFRAFDGISTSASLYCTAVGSTSGQYVGYIFPQAKQISGWSISEAVDSNIQSMPTSVTLQGSADGTTGWTNIDTRTMTWTAGLAERKVFLLAAAVAYRGYRLLINSWYGGLNYIVISEVEFLSANAATIIGSSYALTGAAAGRLILRGYNADATSALDIGNSGSNKIEVYQSIDGNTTWSSALAVASVESLGDNLYQYTTPELDLSAAIGFGFKLQSDAVNFRLLDVLALWRNVA